MSRQFTYYGSFASAQYFTDFFGVPVAAYSLRKLSPNSVYSGAAIRVRRSSDNTEQDINFVSSSPNAAIDTSALLSFVGAGNGFVTIWYNQNGSGNNLTQTTAGNQPRIVNGGVVDTENGNSALNFNGTSHTMIAAFSIINQPNTIFTVAKSGPFTNLRLLYDDDNGNDRHTLSAELVGRTTAFAGAPLDANVGWGNLQRLHNVLYNGSSSVLRRDGSNIATGNVGNQGLSGFRIGSRFSNQNYWLGTAQEFIIYNFNQSSNQSAIETNINDYYNVF